MTRIPSKQQIMDWVADHPDANSKRDIAKAFGVKGAQRIELKRLLKELESDGQLERRRRHYLDAEKLPPVTVLELRFQKQLSSMLIFSPSPYTIWATKYCLKR